ncbi:hypothetical protein FB555_001021 [Alpinimonas psychrophila]|uniref:Uncharacterized protein n=1 Tax=Alpinimonas psychrophila TaxID=748908 RepID=A0A7W3JTH7_9MICO|nr:hypothetical protein [Alpinimonas psychrophila]
MERNWCCRLGEIDIVARDGDTNVFLEVKTSSDIGAGDPSQCSYLPNLTDYGVWPVRGVRRIQGFMETSALMPSLCYPSA